MEHLVAAIPLGEQDELIQVRTKYGEHWIGHVGALELPNGQVIPRGHFGFGMAIRNSLRTAGFLDNQTPSGNWDDHYVPVLEAVLDRRVREAT